MALDLQAYLQRIGYHGDTAPSPENLHNIHRHHIYSVPFENLDIHIDRPIVLNTDAIYDKLVTRRRGGFCYEQNGLFAEMLRLMGYDVRLMEARVYRDDGSLGIRWDHLALLVEHEERWLCDVGFGQSFVEPLQFDSQAPQPRNNHVYRVVHDGSAGDMSVQKDGDWHNEFHFDMEARQLMDFAPGCNYHQISPNSGFTQKRVCSLATPTGRLTLSGLTLIETIDGQRTETTLRSKDEVTQVLKECFGVEL